MHNANGMHVVAAIVTLLLSAQPGTTQEHPSFAGNWVMMSSSGDQSAYGMSVRTGRGGDLVITQDAKTLTVSWVSYSRSHQAVQAVVALDGSERRYIDRNSVEPQERTTRAAWLERELAITTHWAGYARPDGNSAGPIDVVETLSLQADLLIVSVVQRTPNGIYKGRRVFRRQ